MMGALIRALTNNAVENIEEALGMTDATSSAMKHAIAEWYAAWYGRAPVSYTHLDVYKRQARY